MAKFKETIRTKTKRTNGRSLRSIIADINLTLRGWFGFFQHSYHTTFKTVDGWIRGRLGAYCANVPAEKAADGERIISTGRMPSLPNMGTIVEAAHARASQSPCG